jgi:YbgC/YbaW family acyl-CoA thioester hydrolase
VIVVHQLPIRPRFGELDPYNHVNHSVYVAWFEAARCEALESIGLALHSLAERGLQIVVVDLAVKYRKPARAGDDLVVETAVTEIGGVTSTWSQRLVRLRSGPGRPQAPDALVAPVEAGPELLCEATIRAGICDLHGRPTRAGAAIRHELEPLFVGAEEWRNRPLIER